MTIQTKKEKKRSVSLRLVSSTCPLPPLPFSQLVRSLTLSTMNQISSFRSGTHHHSGVGFEVVVVGFSATKGKRSRRMGREGGGQLPVRSFLLPRGKF